MAWQEKRGPIPEWRRSKENRHGSSDSAWGTVKVMQDPPFDGIDSSFDILDYVFNVPDGQLNRQYRGFLEEMDSTAQRVEKAVEDSKSLVCKADYLKVLKNLYEETKQEPGNFFLYYLGDAYRPKHILKPPLSPKMLRSDTGIRSAASDDNQYLPRLHMERMDEEIKRLQNVMFRQLLERIGQLEEKCGTRLVMLNDVVDWLTIQQYTMEKHLLSFYNMWILFDDGKELALYQQLNSFMEYFEKAVRQTKKIAGLMFGIGLSAEDKELLSTKLPRKLPGHVVKLTANQVPTAGAMFKKKEKFNWAVNKLNDIFTVCSKLTESPDVQNTLQCGMSLFKNMMSVIKSNFEELEDMDENLGFLHKNLAEVCKSLEEGTQKLSEKTRVYKALEAKYKKLKKNLNNVLTQNERLEGKLDYLGKAYSQLNQDQQKPESAGWPQRLAVLRRTNLQDSPISGAEFWQTAEAEFPTSAKSKATEPPSGIQLHPSQKVPDIKQEDTKAMQLLGEIEFYRDTIASLKDRIDTLRTYAEKLEDDLGMLPGKGSRRSSRLPENVREAMTKAAIIAGDREISPSVSDHKQGVPRCFSTTWHGPASPDISLAQRSQDEIPPTSKTAKRKEEHKAEPSVYKTSKRKEETKAEPPVSKATERGEEFKVEPPVSETAKRKEEKKMETAVYKTAEKQENGMAEPAVTKTAERKEGPKAELYSERQTGSARHRQDTGQSVESDWDTQSSHTIKGSGPVTKVTVSKTRGKKTDQQLQPPKTPKTVSTPSSALPSRQSAEKQRKPSYKKKAETGKAVTPADGRVSKKISTAAEPKSRTSSADRKRSPIKQGVQQDLTGRKKKSDVQQELRRRKKKSDVQQDVGKGKITTGAWEKARPEMQSSLSTHIGDLGLAERQDGNIGYAPEDVVGPYMYDEHDTMKTADRQNRAESFQKRQDDLGTTETSDSGSSLPRKPATTKLEDAWQRPQSVAGEHPSTKLTEKLAQDRGAQQHPETQSATPYEPTSWCHDDCALYQNILDQFLCLGWELSLILDSHGLPEHAEKVREAQSALDVLLIVGQDEGIRNLADGVETYFKRLQKAIQEALAGINIKSVEEKLAEKRQKNIQELNQKAANTQRKQSALEEQYRSLWFMYLALCDNVSSGRQVAQLDVTFDTGDVNKTPLTAVEMGLKLSKDLVANNINILTDAFQNKKISQKCLDAGKGCLDELEEMCGGHLPFLVNMYTAHRRLADIDSLTNEQQKVHADKADRRLKWQTWRTSQTDKASHQLSLFNTNRQQWKTQRVKTVFNAWFLFNQILVETGVKLVFPQPRVSAVDEPTRVQFSKVIRDVAKEKSVPLITPQNYQEVVSSGKLPASFHKKPALMWSSADCSLNVDSRQSIRQAMGSQGFSISDIARDDRRRSPLKIEKFSDKTPRRMSFKRPASIAESLDEISEDQ